MATETLRPNAAGAENNIPSQWPTSTLHYDKVDEVSSDGGSTIVYNGAASDDWTRDFYNVGASGLSAETINHLTVYARAWSDGATPIQHSIKICIRSNSTPTEDVEQTVTTSEAPYSKQWTKNPADGEDWEVADLADLQIGISIRRCSTETGQSTIVTQVYVVVDYEAVAVGRSFGFIIG